MAINNLYLSTAKYDWFLHKDNKVFLNSKNLAKIISDENFYDCYTSIEDSGFNFISEIVNSAKNIILVDINEETISELDESSVFSYFNFIKLARHKISSNLNFLDVIFSTIDTKHNYRMTENPVLWTVGCSFTAGEGVNADQRYGHILAKNLNLSEIMLATVGTSIFWAADQILRSDIRKGDIVIWGLTNSSRINYNNKFNLVSAPVDTYVKLSKQKQFWNLDYFDSLSLTISNFKQILQVINFCNKIGARLYLVNLLDQGLISLLLLRFKNFIDLSNSDLFNSKTQNPEYLDLGSDSQHPGPKQHKFYAEKIYELIKQDEISRT